MTNEKIIVINNRTVEKAKRALGMHAAKRGVAPLETLMWTAVQRAPIPACVSGAALISALHGDIYYAQSVPMMPCWRVCLCAGDMSDSLARRWSRAARSVV